MLLADEIFIISNILKKRVDKIIRNDVLKLILNMSTMEKIKKIIVDNLDLNISIEDIRDSNSLYEDGLGLDSIAIVALMWNWKKIFTCRLKIMN